MNLSKYVLRSRFHGNLTVTNLNFSAFSRSCGSTPLTTFLTTTRCSKWLSVVGVKRCTILENSPQHEVVRICTLCLFHTFLSIYGTYFVEQVCRTSLWHYDDYIVSVGVQTNMTRVWPPLCWQKLTHLRIPTISYGSVVVSVVMATAEFILIIVYIYVALFFMHLDTLISAIYYLHPLYIWYLGMRLSGHLLYLVNTTQPAQLCLHHFAAVQWQLMDVTFSEPVESVHEFTLVRSVHLEHLFQLAIWNFVTRYQASER